jgi:lipopolysaccharide export system protein LptA
MRLAAANTWASGRYRSYLKPDLRLLMGCFTVSKVLFSTFSVSARSVGLFVGVVGLMVGFSRTTATMAQVPNAAVVQGGRALTIRSDTQEANSKTGVVTARGNVQVNYPARQIQATAAQAQYYSRERRIVMTGNVYVLQNGNSLRGETITYLIDEGRFVANPRTPKQVESIYLVPESAPQPQLTPQAQTVQPLPSALPATLQLPTIVPTGRLKSRSI